MIKGRMRVKYHEHDEIINAGEVYFLPTGHVPVIEEDIEIVEFSPKGEYQKTMEVANRNFTVLKKAG
jgi:hypothetical protein